MMISYMGRLSFISSVEVPLVVVIGGVEKLRASSHNLLQGTGGWRHSSIGLLVTLDSTMTLDITPKKSDDAKGVLRWAALFLGELRDGLTMVRVQR